jgi:predicted Ser/Thr protein kinase
VSEAPIKLDPLEASGLRRWLSAVDSRPAPLTSGYQGAVYLYEGTTGPRIIKEALGRGPQYWLGRAMLRREFKAYQRVQGIAGIPHCYGMLDERFLVLEFVAGEGLRAAPMAPAARERFFAQLLETLRQVHAAGVTHNDLKRKDNVLAAPSGSPVLLDFGLAFFRKGDADSWLFRLLKRMDYNSWIKLKYHTAIDDIAPEDLPYYQPTPLERGFRLGRRFWRTVTLRQWRKRRQLGKDQRKV